MNDKVIDKTIVIAVSIICLTIYGVSSLWHDYAIHSYEPGRECDVRFFKDVTSK